MLRVFHIRLADPKERWKTHNYWFNKQTEVHVFIEERMYGSN